MPDDGADSGRDERATASGSAGEHVSTPSSGPMGAIESKYWIWHLYMALWWVMWIPVGILLGLGDASGSFGEVAALPGYLLILLLIPAAFGSLIGYHVEAGRLKKARSQWVPNPWLYTHGHVILSPLIAAPLYLYQRRRHIGLPWHNLRLWG